MDQNEFVAPPADLICARCNQPMTLERVTVSYLGHTFPSDLLKLMKCPSCGRVHVPEALATGQMLEVEQLLEDK